MPAKLKGSATIKIPEGAKPGDEITVEDVTFIADQDDFDRSVRDRLKQQQKKHDEEKQGLEAKITELESKNAPEPSQELKQLKDRLAEMDAKQAQRDLQDRVTAELEKQGLVDLPKAYRSLINAKPDASDEELAAMVKEAGDEFTALRTKLAPEAPVAPAKPSFGAPGSGGSKDQQKKIDSLRSKVQANRPDLMRHLTGLSDEMALDVMQTWDTQGDLKPKS